MSRDLLIELGTEELPPTALKNLSAAFTQGIEDGLKEAGLSFADVVSFAAPRRLAVRINALEEQQADKEETLYGPPAKIAFDADGKPTKAAIGFQLSVPVLTLLSWKPRRNPTAKMLAS